MLKLARLADDKLVENEMFKVAKKMEVLARAKVRRKSGKLASAITAKRFKRRVKNNPAVFFAVDKDILMPGWRSMSSRARPFYYHLAIERGTSKMPAHPYYRPAVDTYRRSFSRDVVKGVRRAIKKRARG